MTLHLDGVAGKESRRLLGKKTALSSAGGGVLEALTVCGVPNERKSAEQKQQSKG